MSIRVHSRGLRKALAERRLQSIGSNPKQVIMGGTNRRVWCHARVVSRLQPTPPLAPALAGGKESRLRTTPLATWPAIRAAVPTHGERQSDLPVQVRLHAPPVRCSAWFGAVDAPPTHFEHEDGDRVDWYDHRRNRDKSGEREHMGIKKDARASNRRGCRAASRGDSAPVPDRGLQS
jgi:hypothetical protein